MEAQNNQVHLAEGDGQHGQDRALLEKAARAAGFVFDAERLHECDVPALWLTKPRVWWNPLVDDGDALRLAVKLGLMIDVYDEVVCVSKRLTTAVHMESTEGDPYAAARRAIVRVAAERGA